MAAKILPVDLKGPGSPVEQSPPLTAIPQLPENISDILAFPSLESLDQPSPRTPLPPIRHTVLDTDSMILSPRLIRRIEHEMTSNQYDSRTVFSACRGLTRGSAKFDEAYIAARISVLSKPRRPATTTLLSEYPAPEIQPQNFHQPAMHKALPPRSHPMAVIHLGDLISHFGIFVIGLLATQLWAAWRIGTFTNEFLGGGRNFHAALGLVVMLAINSWVWFRRRGNLSSAFHAPGGVLFLMAALPAFALYLRETILTLK